MTTEPDKTDEDTEELTIGIYSLSTEEMEKPSEERTYSRKGLWTPEGWAQTSNPSIIQDAPEEKTYKAFKQRFGLNTHRWVFRPETVPGEVVVDEPTFTAEEIGLEDVEWAD